MVDEGRKKKDGLLPPTPHYTRFYLLHTHARALFTLARHHCLPHHPHPLHHAPGRRHFQPGSWKPSGGRLIFISCCCRLTFPAFRMNTFLMSPSASCLLTCNYGAVVLGVAGVIKPCWDVMTAYIFILVSFVSGLPLTFVVPLPHLCLRLPATRAACCRALTPLPFTPPLHNTATRTHAPTFPPW